MPAKPHNYDRFKPFGALAKLEPRSVVWARSLQYRGSL